MRGRNFKWVFLLRKLENFACEPGPPVRRESPLEFSPPPYAGQPRSVIATVRGGDKAEQAYRRSDALEKRRKLMEAWAAYCEPKGADNVLQIPKR